MQYPCSKPAVNCLLHRFLLLHNKLNWVQPGKLVFNCLSLSAAQNSSKETNFLLHPNRKVTPVTQQSSAALPAANSCSIPCSRCWQLQLCTECIVAQTQEDQLLECSRSNCHLLLKPWLLAKVKIFMVLSICCEIHWDLDCPKQTGRQRAIMEGTMQLKVYLCSEKELLKHSCSPHAQCQLPIQET